MADKYNWKLTIWKGVKYLVFFGVPTGIAAYIQFDPVTTGLTVGTVLTMFANFLQNYNK